MSLKRSNIVSFTKSVEIGILQVIHLFIYFSVNSFLFFFLVSALFIYNKFTCVHG